MGPQPFEYRFTVVENSQLNAFAVPGGSIYIHTGLIEKARSTDELASVVGHEMSHVKARHIARMSGPDPVNLLGLLGLFLGGAGTGGQAAAMLGPALAATKQLAYSRTLEQEADTLGVKHMAEAGFDPHAALSFFQIINQEKILNPVDAPAYLLTHPLTRERIGSVEAIIGSLRLKRPGLRGPDPIRKIQILLRLRKNESDALIANHEKFISRQQGTAESWHVLGMAYHDKGKLSLAREKYERARNMDSNRPGIHRDLGRLYTQIGEYRLAHESFQRSLKKDVSESLTYLYLGDLYDHESKFRDAAQAYYRATSLSPLWAEPARRLGAAYKKMNRLGNAYYYLGRSHLLFDEDGKAIDAMEKALEIFGSISTRGQMIRDELDEIKQTQ
jgi:predicted Zn-dependent protease